MDLARFYLRVKDGRVVEARFQSYGCGPTIAASSAATELAAGQGIEALTGVSAAQIEAAVGGLPEERRHAADVVALALRSAARDVMQRHSGGHESGEQPCSSE